MLSKQISVFIENRKGRLGEVLDVLKGAGVNIISCSLADTVEYGLLRIISDKPEEGANALLAAGFSAVLTEVFIIKLPHIPGALQTVLRLIAKEEISVEYMYGLSAETEGASLVIKTSDIEKASVVFEKQGIETL